MRPSVFSALAWIRSAFAAALLLTPSWAAAQEVRIAVAASFRDAVEEIVAEYAKAGRPKPVAVYGATGNLMRQITQGAPFDVFLAADEESTQKLAADGLTTGPPEVLVKGRLSLIVNPSSGMAPDAELAGLRTAMDAQRLQRFAIANPEIAPYGRAAREALEKLGLLPKITPYLVFGENVGQVAQYVATGAAQAGLTAQSVVMVEPAASQVKSVVLPTTLHAPINQTLVVLKRSGPAGISFADHLKSAASYAIFERYGFVRP